jgi:ankyrin repeat protein
VNRHLISLISLLALVVSGNCARHAQKQTIANQNDDNPCARKADLQLISAAVRDHSDEMETAIKSGADVNAIVERIGPPLVIATLIGNHDGVQILLANGANVSAADADGYTPILTAALFDRRDIAKLLLSNGADVNAVCYIKTKGGEGKFTPLLIAKTKGYDEMARLLTAAGAKE